MFLFQTQVERQFLVGITTDLNPIYIKFLTYFGDPVIQANILEVKEEQYQGEFIRALFVDVLGYTAQPQPNFNLLREKKNETDSKSADAAISINNKIVAVIELKDHKTQDLKKVEVQAFGYKNNHKNCHYIVTSNFERLRFYIDNAVDFIEFDLFNLTFEDFRRLWLCLSYESIAKNLPQEIKNQSISSEDVITKKLYKDYSVFKRLLFDNIVLLNTEHDKLLLFKKTQKLLDRFLFLFFAEDKNLLPANSIQGTVEKWKKFNADPMNDYQSLYSRYVKYFKLLDEGYKDNNIEIYAYNGGLFANDELLNQIKVNDDILAENVLKLAAYDYDTDVDVNILGHIFENSLSEIDEVITEINKGVKTISKRKQDGVIYTPRYITQYIVENTIGRLCEEKKQELGIGEELFEYKRADKRKQALKVFDIYREWLLQITIVDPACGSGAFLNSALDFLIAEHKWIDTQQEKIAGLKGHYSMQLGNIENTILENNLFGVDINEESVEIAKLSLWLRTAKPHRKLSSLNNNIKCGNSLIVDPAIAGKKAFDWYKEFPQVFGRKLKTDEEIIIKKEETPNYLKLIKEKSLEAQQKAEQGIALSKEALEITKQLTEYTDKLEAVSEPLEDYKKLKTGFDVVIGNPPYVRADSPGNTLEFREHLVKSKYFETLAGKWDLYIPFVEQCIKLSNNKGKISLIIPDAYCHADYAQKSLEYVKSNRFLFQIDYFPEFMVFENVGVKSVIVNFNKNNSTNFIQRIHHSENSFTETIFDSYPVSFRLDSKESILNNVPNYYLLNQICYSSKGIVGNSDEKKYKGEFEVGDLLSGIKDETHPKLYFEGKDIGKWILFRQRWIEYGTDRSPSRWSRKGFKEMFEGSPKLVAMRSPGNIPRLMLDENNGYFNESAIGFKRWIDLKDVSNNSINKVYGDEDERIGFETLSSLYSYSFLLSILNSSVIRYELNTNRRSNIHIYPEDWKVLKIPKIEKGNFVAIELEKKGEQMLILNKELMVSTQKFQRMLQRKFNLEELPTKLQSWYLLSYKEFIAELGKKKVKLTLAHEAEWEEYFNTECTKAVAIKSQIETTDREIDNLVYQLYTLTEEEVKIVEGKK
ncbi:MAG: Eco57I restriction-modification methylase domain-containing protein [Paludibacter sp.]